MENGKIVHVAVVKYTLPGDYHGPNTLIFNTENLYKDKNDLMNVIKEHLEDYPMKGNAVIDKDDYLNEKTLCGSLTIYDVPKEPIHNSWNPYDEYSIRGNQAYYVDVMLALYVPDVDMLFDLKEFSILEE